MLNKLETNGHFGRVPYMRVNEDQIEEYHADLNGPNSILDDDDAKWIKKIKEI